MGENNSILNSELAVQILKATASSTDGKYPTKLAEELDKTQPSISRLLTELHQIGFLKKGERGQTQYYKVNYEGIADYWHDKLCRKLRKAGAEESLEDFSQKEEEIRKVAKEFFQKILADCDISDQIILSELLFESFSYAIVYNLIRDQEFLEKHNLLSSTVEALQLRLHQNGFHRSFEEALRESLKEE